MTILSLSAIAATPAPSHQETQDAEHNRAAELAARDEANASLRIEQADAARLAFQRVQAANHPRTTEAAAARATAQLDDLEQRNAKAHMRLAARSADLQPMLPLIERLAVFPWETILAVPAAPAAALRGVMLLHGLTMQIERDAEAARQDQWQIAKLNRDNAAESARLAAARTAQATAKAALDLQISGAQQTVRAAEESGPEAAHGAAGGTAHTGSERGAVVPLKQPSQTDDTGKHEDGARAPRERNEADASEANRRTMTLAAPVVRGLAELHGQLTTPVEGIVIHNFGDATESGVATGITYRVPRAAQVISPCGGKVVFAGPFRSFGLLLILDCGGGYHFVLSGLDRVGVQVGRQIQTGEPVGVMPSWSEGVSDHTTVNAQATLYMELRHDGAPVNPSLWLKLHA